MGLGVMTIGTWEAEQRDAVLGQGRKPILYGCDELLTEEENRVNCQ